MAVDLHQVEAAHERIAPLVVRTPVLAVPGTGVRVKAEGLQPTGSFKVRAAANFALGLDEADRRRGLIAHSSGNHAVAVAHVGRQLDLATVVVMPTGAPRAKADRVAALGAEIVWVGPSSSERAAVARDLADRHGHLLVEPYDSDHVIAATGTISVEALHDAGASGAEPIDAIYVPVSGGGLAAGVALAAKALDPSITVIGVEPEVAADYRASRRAGRIVELPAGDMDRTIADGLRVQRVGDRCWPYLQAHVDAVATVSEQQIRDAVAVLAGAGLVVEPSGAAAVAAALGPSGSVEPAGADAHVGPQRRLAIASGSNVDLELLAELVHRAPRS